MPLPAGAAEAQNLSRLGIPVTLPNGRTAYAQATVLVDTSGTPVSSGSASSSTATGTTVPAATSAQTLLAANPNRRGATVYYDDTAILYLLEGAGTPSPTNFTYKMGAGYYTAYDAPEGFTGPLKGIWSVATGAAFITERTA